MSRSTDQPVNRATIDLAALRDGLKQLLDLEHYRLASTSVMADVEGLYQQLVAESPSISEPGLLLDVCRTFGDLAAALADGRLDAVHLAARTLAAQFLFIADAELDAQDDFETRDRLAGCSEPPPF